VSALTTVRDIYCSSVILAAALTVAHGQLSGATGCLTIYGSRSGWFAKRVKRFLSGVCLWTLSTHGERMRGGWRFSRVQSRSGKCPGPVVRMDDASQVVRTEIPTGGRSLILLSIPGSRGGAMRVCHAADGPRAKAMGCSQASAGRLRLGPHRPRARPRLPLEGVGLTE
jgi:hypothetical protein